MLLDLEQILEYLHIGGSRLGIYVGILVVADVR
jgi:hypothetical protein